MRPLAWRSSSCCHPGEFCNKTRVISSQCCSLNLVCKILKNKKKGRLTLAQLIYESCWALLTPPTHPFPSWRDPQLCARFTGHIGLKPPMCDLLTFPGGSFGIQKFDLAWVLHFYAPLDPWLLLYKLQWSQFILLSLVVKCMYHPEPAWTEKK